MRFFRHLILFSFLAFLCSVSFGQAVSYYQAQFNGGVTTGGYSPDYSSGGSGSFTLSIAPGSTIQQAYLLAGRHGSASPLTVSLNGTSLTFNNGNQASPTFQSPIYGGNSGVHSIDVTAVINPAVNNYTLSVPSQPGPTDRYNDFYLYVAYANNSLQQVNTAIFLNAADIQQSASYPLTLTYGFSNSSNVALSMFTGYACNTFADGENITVNGTNIGLIGNPDFNSGSCGGPIGSFGFQNGMLTGLGDDNCDQAMTGPDALSNIQALVPPLSTNLTIDCSHQSSGTDNAIWAFILAYSANSQPFNIGPDTTVCTGQPVQLNGPGGNTSWTPATGLSCTNCANPVATPLVTTTYIATLTSGTCGSGTDTIIITVTNSGSITIQNNDTVVCTGNSVQLNSTASGTVTWAPATGLSCTNCNNPTATPLVTTTYIASLAGGSCGNGSDTVTITIANNPSITVSNNDTSICSGNTVQLNATANGTVSWAPATGLSCTSCNNPVASPASNITYVATTGGAGCFATDSVIITVQNSPTLSLSNDTSVCSGNSAQLNSASTGTVTWSPSTGLSCTSCNSPVASPSASIVYYANVGSGNCSVTDSVIVTIVSPPSLSVSNNTSICTGSSATLNAVSSGTITWSPATGLSCTNCSSPIANPSVTTTFYVSANTQNCFTNDSVIVTVVSYPTLTVDGDTTVCPGVPVLLSAVSTGNVNWLPSANLSCTNCNTTTAVQSSTTTYFATSANGSCVVMDSVTVTINNTVAIDLGSDATICIGDVIQLNATANAPVTWNPSPTLSCTNCNSPFASPVQTTLYSATAISSTCSASDSVLVTVNSASVQANDDLHTFVGETVQLNATGVDSVIWAPANSFINPNSFNPSVMPVSTTLYHVYGYRNGCMSVDSVWVIVTSRCDNLLIPTGFSPNGDGANDKFKILNNNLDKVNWFRIYNRWGELVFETNDVYEGWDGMFRDVAQPMGVYIYSASVVCLQKTYEFKGNVTLVR